MKPSLIEKISIYLLKKGFTIKILKRTCFDIVARRETQILLIKILEDANSISKEYADQMLNISSYINGSSLIVAEKAGQKLQDNVVYMRFNIYTLNLNSFKGCIENKFPFIVKTQAGLTAHILGNKLREIRESEGLSLSEIARKVGVSKRMVQKYESGQSEVTVNKALRIYDIFGHKVFNKIDVFSEVKGQTQDKKSDITKKYSDLGFRASETKKVPFDVVAKKEKEIILTEIGDKTRPELKSLSRLIDADRLAIFNKKKPKDMPALTKEEFLEFEKAKELIKFLKEFEKNS